jgi:hypothetical protein
MNPGGIRTTNAINGNGAQNYGRAKFSTNIKSGNYDPGDNTRITSEHRQNSYINSTGNRPNSKVVPKANGYLTQNKGSKMVVD